MIDHERLQVATNRVWDYSSYLVLKTRDHGNIQYRVFDKIGSGLHYLLDCSSLEDVKTFIRTYAAATAV